MRGRGLQWAKRLFRWRRRDFLIVGLCVPIALSRLLMTPSIGAAAPLMTTWIGVVIAAWLGGLWPAIIVGVIGFAAGQHIMVSSGFPLMGPGVTVIYALFLLLVAIPGEIYQRMAARRKVDRRQLAEMQIRLQQTARLNAMGELAGTLAHELNQPLTAIASYADAAEWTLQSGREGGQEQAAELLRKIVAQTRRARSIMTRVRSYVTGDELELAPQSLSNMVEEVVELVSPEGARGGLNVRCAFDPAADQVLADRIQIQQVMVNLVRNAIEAMERAPRRQLVISTRPRDDGLVECRIADSGPGLSDKIAGSLFEPFATDKPAGTGIGLAICRTIVEGHGGKIWGENDPAGGAVFGFTLKRVHASAEA